MKEDFIHCVTDSEASKVTAIVSSDRERPYENKTNPPLPAGRQAQPLPFQERGARQKTFLENPSIEKGGCPIGREGLTK